MSDPKRATLITVGAPKNAKNNVNKTVRLAINLDESNESKYPELNYKELVITEEKKKKVENGKTPGLDPFSDNDDDVERVARKFEQKYGGKSTYGRKGRSKQDDFADIGAGYDENDSFIDNTDGYDEMIPPECDTLYGGFYINSGSLEFKTVPQEQSMADEPAGRRNKRRISSSSSEEESSESSSESESQDEKDPKPIANGEVDSHKTEHRKKKNKKIDKQKAKKIRRTDSSAANSGKQTSDDNAQVDGESADSRTSQSDSLTSKPGPSSENAITSDSSRDTEAKIDAKLPQTVVKTLELLEASVAKQLVEHPTMSAKQLLASNEQHLIRLEQALECSGSESRVSRACLSRAAAALQVPVNALQALLTGNNTNTQTTQPTPATVTRVPTNNNKRPLEDNDHDNTVIPADKEGEIAQILKRLQTLIDERKAGLIANYNAECQRVQEERKQLQICGGSSGERRLPKRRFPWCSRVRALLLEAVRCAGGGAAAARLLHDRVLPLFPAGFVRMPTLLKQADLNKDIKASEMKRRRLKSASQVHPVPPVPAIPQPQLTQPATMQPTITQQTTTQPATIFPEQIQFPSSLTVTTTVNKTSPDKIETDDKFKSNSMFGSLMNTFSLGKDLIVEKEKKDDKKEDSYIPNNIGSITITPVPSQKEKKQDKQQGFIRVKSPAALNEMAKKEAKTKKTDKINSNNKEKRVQSPLHIDTNHQSNKKDPSPKTKDEVTQKHIENLRNSESNIPRPALVPVHHSPTFAKPDKRPPEVKKKKELLIMSDVDPLAETQEPLAVDDSSSDVEVIESDKFEVPSKDSGKSVPKKDGKYDESNDDIDKLMRNIREMEYSQETKYNSNSHGGVITNAKHESSNASGVDRNHSIFGNARTDKFIERTSLNKTDGCNNGITG